MTFLNMTLNKIGQLSSVLEINPGLSAPILTIDLQWNTVVLFPCVQMVYVGRIRSVCLPIEPPLNTLICYLNVAWAEEILNSTALTSLRMGESTELPQLLTHREPFLLHRLMHERNSLWSNQNDPSTHYIRQILDPKPWGGFERNPLLV